MNTNTVFQWFSSNRADNKQVNGLLPPHALKGIADFTDGPTQVDANNALSHQGHPNTSAFHQENSVPNKHKRFCSKQNFLCCLMKNKILFYYFEEQMTVYKDCTLFYFFDEQCTVETGYFEQILCMEKISKYPVLMLKW